MSFDNVQDFENILQLVSYPGMRFVVRQDGIDRFYLQVECNSVCNITGKPMYWRGRKWFLSRHMVKSEIVQTAFIAVITALEHEAREKFLYAGRSVFDLHYDIDALWELRSQPNCQDIREEHNVKK